MKKLIPLLALSAAAVTTSGLAFADNPPMANVDPHCYSAVISLPTWYSGYPYHSQQQIIYNQTKSTCDATHNSNYFKQYAQKPGGNPDQKPHRIV
jgi:hypothetical protein